MNAMTEATEAVDLTTLPAGRLPYRLTVIDAGYGRRYWSMVERYTGEGIGHWGSTGPESQFYTAEIVYGVAPTQFQKDCLVYEANYSITKAVF